MKTDTLLIRGHAVLALTLGPDSDFPWFVGRFERLEYFSDYERYFDVLDRTNGSARWLGFERLEADGIAPSEVTLRETAGETTFVHAVVLRDDGSASWRIGSVPLPADDEDA